MKTSIVFLLSLLGIASAFSPSSRATSLTKSGALITKSSINRRPTHLKFFQKENVVEEKLTTVAGAGSALDKTESSEEAELFEESQTAELLLLGLWGVSISAFILINNFYGPWPLAMKAVPERIFFLSHMIGGMLFGGGIILTTCIERLIAKSSNAPVLQFWFDKVPVLDGLIVVPALTVSMISGTGLSIVRYGGLNIAPPHVGAIFWTLIAFMSWWAATDLTTQGTALAAVNEMYDDYENGDKDVQTPKVVVDRHVSNVVSCFFVVLLYSMMVLKPGTLIPFPWNA